MRVEAACIFFGSVYRWKCLKIFLLILRRRHEFHHKYWYYILRDDVWGCLISAGQMFKGILYKWNVPPNITSVDLIDRLTYFIK
jgi:hypothetical protein